MRDFPFLLGTAFALDEFCALRSRERAAIYNAEPDQQGEHMFTASTSLMSSHNQTQHILPSCPKRNQLRMVRPSLLDLRFTGDPWIVDREDGSFRLFLGDYCLTWFQGMTFDLPAFNQALERLRSRRPRPRCRAS